MRMKRLNGKNGICYIYLVGCGLVLKDIVFYMLCIFLDRVGNVVIFLKMELKLRIRCLLVSLLGDVLYRCLLFCFTYIKVEVVDLILVLR